VFDADRASPFTAVQRSNVTLQDVDVISAVRTAGGDPFRLMTEWVFDRFYMFLRVHKEIML